MVGADRTVTWYRKRDGWKGTVLSGVSWDGELLRSTADQRGRNGSTGTARDQGERLEREIRVMIPLASLPKDYPDKNGAIRDGIFPGDILVLGTGPERLTGPSQPEREGRAFLTVSRVRDGRFGLWTDHVLVMGY